MEDQSITSKLLNTLNEQVKIMMSNQGSIRPWFWRILEMQYLRYLLEQQLLLRGMLQLINLIKLSENM